MTTILARVIADSISPAGKRLTTIQCRYPLVIHAEVMTHRLFSRNARSSRAVPIKTMIQDCLDDPFIPEHWGAAQKGMQADQECDNCVYVPWTDFEVVDDRVKVVTVPHMMPREEAWLHARDVAVKVAQSFGEAGYHKQIANRLLAPFLNIDTLITSTEWDNFFALRDHPDAEPHVMRLAQAARRALSESTPRPLEMGQWHMPYIDFGYDYWDATEGDWIQGDLGDDHGKVCVWLSAHHNGGSFKDVIDHLCLASVARCARVSYKPFTGSGDIGRDIELARQLKNSGHWSPFEHIASPDGYVSDKALVKQWRSPSMHRNFTGWQQFRAVIGG